MRETSTRAPWRILALALTGILLQANLVSPTCLDRALHHGRASAQTSGRQDDSSGDPDCCAYCFCCHFSGLLASHHPAVSLAAAGFVTAAWNPPPLHPTAHPPDRPPRP